MISSVIRERNINFTRFQKHQEDHKNEYNEFKINKKMGLARRFLASVDIVRHICNDDATFQTSAECKTISIYMCANKEKFQTQ